MKTSEVVLGADPEIFVENGEGKMIPAFSFLPSKYEPLRTPEGQTYYMDGLQCEFNVAPSSKISEALLSVRTGMKAVLRAGQQKDPTARLSTKTVFDVPLSVLAELPVEFTEFGCMPSYNVYGITGRGGEGHTVPYRFAGGHIHFGITDSDEAMEKIPSIVRALDATLGVACVSLFENLDNPVRREYYGLAGEHRLPPHGLEYRALSCAWLFHKKLAETVLDLSRKVLVSVVNDKYKWEASQDEVVECMLTCNVGMARKILERNMTELKDLGYKANIDLLSPVEKSLPSVFDIAGNWGF